MKGSQTWVDAKLFRQGGVWHIREYIIMHQSHTSVIQHTCKDEEHSRRRKSAVMPAAPWGCASAQCCIELNANAGMATCLSDYVLMFCRCCGHHLNWALTSASLCERRSGCIGGHALWGAFIQQHAVRYCTSAPLDFVGNQQQQLLLRSTQEALQLPFFSHLTEKERSCVSLPTK